jgi:hypothetical protein
LLKNLEIYGRLSGINGEKLVILNKNRECGNSGENLTIYASLVVY